MAKKNKGLELPNSPTYYQNPNVNTNIDFGSNIGKKLLSSDYTGELGGLADLVSYNPMSTQLALESARGFLTPQYNELRNQAVQDATNANALNSSTFTDALAKNQFNLESQYQGIAADAALKDKYAADANRINLFQYGGDLLNSNTGLGLQQSQQQNQFNLANYENQVAKMLASQKQSSGGLLGALTGGAGGAGLGAALGAALALPTGGLSLGAGALFGGLAGGGLGALAGGLSTQGTGGQLLNAGASAIGSFAGSQVNPTAKISTGNSYLPGMFAQNQQTNPYRLVGALDNNPFGL